MQQKQVKPEDSNNTDSYEPKYSRDIDMKTDSRKFLDFHILGEIFSKYPCQTFFYLLKIWIFLKTRWSVIC